MWFWGWGDPLAHDPVRGKVQRCRELDPLRRDHPREQGWVVIGMTWLLGVWVIMGHLEKDDPKEMFLKNDGEM